jgi:hypothetical protein
VLDAVQRAISRHPRQPGGRVSRWPTSADATRRSRHVNTRSASASSREGSISRSPAELGMCEQTVKVHRSRRYAKDARVLARRPRACRRPVPSPERTGDAERYARARAHGRRWVPRPRTCIHLVFPLRHTSVARSH